MNILFDDTFQSIGLENILTRTDRRKPINVGVKTNIPGLIGTYSESN
jgi:hypothetical protein